MVKLMKNQEFNYQVEKLKDMIQEGILNNNSFTVLSNLLTEEGLMYLVDEVARNENLNVVRYISETKIKDFHDMFNIDTLILLGSEDYHMEKILKRLGYKVVIIGNVETYEKYMKLV